MWIMMVWLSQHMLPPPPSPLHTHTSLFRAYDRSLVRLRGASAATNFGLAEYRANMAEYHQVQQVQCYYSPV